MIEKVVTFASVLTGIITLPSSRRAPTLPGVIFLCADPVHNRIGVALCRYLAERGLVSFRFDLSGSGDSLVHDDPRSIKDIWVEDAVAAMDLLATENLLESFVILGICKGARIAAEVALIDSRVAGIVPINFDSPANAVSKKAKLRHLIDPNWWAYLGVGRISKRLLRLVRIGETRSGGLAALHAQFGDFFGSDETEIISVWQRVLQKPIGLLIVFSQYDRHFNFFKYNVKPKLSFKELPGSLQLAIIRNADHNMTALAARIQLHCAVSNWLIREFETECNNGSQTLGANTVMES